MQLWPPVDVPRTLTRQVWDSESARTIPGVGRALSIYGLLGQMPLSLMRGIRPLPAPRLLDRPDPTHTRAWFVRAHVEDYLLHGNACHLITARGSDGYPAAVRWFPAHQWQLTDDDGETGYWLNGRRVNPVDVVHVQRGADPSFPGRGVGVVEQHVRALDGVGLQDAAERENLRGRGMPGVAIITPQKEPKEEDLDAAADKWLERFGPGTGSGLPAFLPNGTQVVPLAWSPRDQQMTEARKLSLTDIANVFNLDSYWLGAPGSSHTYRSPGPLFLTLLRTSLDGLREELEDEWSYQWFPRGQRIRFDRNAILVDDLETTIRTARNAVEGRLWTLPEARSYLGLDPDVVPDPIDPPPAPVQEPPTPDPVEDEPPADDDTEETEQ